jgi:hypothetical protein
VNPAHLEALSPAEHSRRHSSLTWESVREIRARCAAGECKRAVAADYGITGSTVGDIASGGSTFLLGFTIAVRRYGDDERTARANALTYFEDLMCRRQGEPDADEHGPAPAMT